MKIIDRYLLKQFLHVFMICFISLTGLYVVLDAFSHLDDFLRFSENQGSLLAVLGEYYFYKSIGFFERLSGVISLIAAMFTVTWIQRHNELTALMAAGISRVRVVKPVIMACVTLAVLTAVGREVVIPRLRQQLSRDARDLAGDQAQQFRPRHDNQTSILLRGNQVYANEQRVETPSFLLPPEFSEWGTQLTAVNAFYQDPHEGRPGGYLLDDVKDPVGIATKPSLRVGEHDVIITPVDAPDWLKPNQCFVVSDVTFEQLRGGQQWRQYSSIAEMVTGLKNPSLDFGPDVRVAVHVRVVQPMLDVTLLFLGLPLVLSRESRNMFLSIGMCVGVVSVYSLTVLSCQYLGTVYMLSPALAAWLPLMVYVPIAVAMFERARR
jgi:lipopolysaccharide export system permease protein